MDIYLACTVRGDRAAIGTARALADAIEDLGHTILTRHLLEDDVDESTERFKLVVATEKVDDFLLMQPPLTMRSEYGGTKGLESIPPSPKVVHTNEWFAKDFQIRIVRG